MFNGGRSFLSALLRSHGDGCTGNKHGVFFLGHGYVQREKTVLLQNRTTTIFVLLDNDEHVFGLLNDNAVFALERWILRSDHAQHRSVIVRRDHSLKDGLVRSSILAQLGYVLLPQVIHEDVVAVGRFEVFLAA